MMNRGQSHHDMGGIDSRRSVLFTLCRAGATDCLDNERHNIEG